MNKNYQLVKNFTAVGSTLGDVHEFMITKNDTALVTVYVRTPWDLSAFGFDGQGFIYDGVFQEIDLATGRLLFEWRASEHIDVADNDHGRGKHGGDDRPWDCYHLNSVEKDDRGNYLVSIRHTSTIYYLDGRTGDIIWRLGRGKSDFTDLSRSRASDFYGQHHARFHDDGNSITLFDNGNYITKSRGMKVGLDFVNMTATLLVSMDSPEGWYSATRGSVTILPETGHFLVGYGSAPAFTEYSSDGQEALCDYQFGALHSNPSDSSALTDKGVASYRVYRKTWQGFPLTSPDVVFNEPESKVFVSWNGATELRRWRLEGVRNGGGSEAWEDVAAWERTAFETNATVRVNDYVRFRLTAEDRDGGELGQWFLTDGDVEVSSSDA